MPGLVGGFGNYFLPVQMGAPDCFKWKVRRCSSYTSSKLNKEPELILPSNIKYYLAGLWEGDGHIWIPANKFTSPQGTQGTQGTQGSGKKYIPQFAITFAEEEYPLVLMLKSLIGGSIRHKVANHAYVLTIGSKPGLIKIIKTLNGCLRTPKIAKFNALISWVNQEIGDTIPTHNVDNSNFLHNAWLSGFIDADGSFDIRVSQTSGTSNKNRVAARFRLEQRKKDPITGESYLEVLTAIASALGVSLNRSIHNENIEYFIVSASSAKSRELIVNYLSQFPLYSSKRLNYLDWLECHFLIKNKSHTTLEGRKTALNLKLGMNSKRTYYNWDHLVSLSLIPKC